MAVEAAMEKRMRSRMLGLVLIVVFIRNRAR
jgi:hypothetical protein